MSIITLNTKAPRLDSERKPRRGNRKHLHRHRTQGIGLSKLKGLSDVGKDVGVWGDTLASQFYADANWSPEQCLCAGILEDARACYRLGKEVNRKCPARQASHDAEVWLLDNDPTWPFSFINVCHILKLEPEWVRAGVFAGRKAA